MSVWQVGARATGVLLKHLIAGLSTLLETVVLDQIIRIPNSVAIDLIAAASRSGMTVSAFVEDVLLKYLDANAKPAVDDLDPASLVAFVMKTTYPPGTYSATDLLPISMRPMHGAVGERKKYGKLLRTVISEHPQFDRCIEANPRNLYVMKEQHHG